MSFHIKKSFKTLNNNHEISFFKEYAEKNVKYSSNSKKPVKSSKNLFIIRSYRY